MDSQLAPLVIFTYKRKDTLKNLITSLLNCDLVSDTRLYIFSDGPRKDSDKEAVEATRNYIKTIGGFEHIDYFFANNNKGLADSIINGVSEIFKQHESIIVLEDDLVVSKNFLVFMNQALDHYLNNDMVFSISGFTTPVNKINDNDVYFTRRASPWGWATWKDRWDKIDWEVSDYQTFRYDIKSRKKFNKMGSDMSSMLDKQLKNKINSWAIRWCYSQFKNDLYTVFPVKSKVLNMGFSSMDATHTKQKFSRFQTELDQSNSTIFHFDDNIQIDRYFIKQFLKPYRFSNRVLYKVLNGVFKGNNR